MRRFTDQVWALVIAIAGAVGVLAAAVLLVHPLWAQVAMGVGVVCAAVVGTELIRRRRLDEILNFKPCKRDEVKPSDFGIRRSAITLRLFGDADPPYIRREEKDREIEMALHKKRALVVRGVTNSGKTHALFAVIEKVLPDRKVVMPRAPGDGPDALVQLMTSHWLIPKWGRYVVVINDLQDRLSMLPVHSIRKWLVAHPRSYVLATYSAESWANRFDEAQASEVAETVVADAEEVTLDDEFEGEALEQARDQYGLPANQTRLGAFLVASERTVAKFDATTGMHRALVLSAVNAVRAGLARPIDARKLIQVARRISEGSGSGHSEQEWSDAIDECVELYEDLPGMLEASQSEGGDLRVMANPVLIDHVDRPPVGKSEQVEPAAEVWKAIVEILVEGPDDLLLMAVAAARRGRADLAEELLGQVRESRGRATVAAEIAYSWRHPERGSAVDGMLDRASAGPDPVVPKAIDSDDTDDSDESDSATREAGPFDPTLPRLSGRRRFYSHQGVRDSIRFGVLLISDIAAVLAGIGVARLSGDLLGTTPDEFASWSIGAVATVAAVAVVFFLLFGLYRSDRQRARLGEIIKGTALVGVSLALMALGRGSDFGEVLVTGFIAVWITAFAVFGLRALYDRVSRGWVRNYDLQSRVLIVNGAQPAATADVILDASRRPMQMVGYLAERQREPGWLGTPDELEEVAYARLVDRVIFADPALSPRKQLALIYRCHAVDLATEVAPAASQLFQGMSDALDDNVVPLVGVRPLYLRYVDARIKKAMDLVFATFASVVLSPAFLLGAAMMKLASPKHPVLVRDYRPGLGAIPFGMWRLRTERDGKLTKPGRFLTRLRINELPQLLNVLAGNMSLVGPRPLTSEEFERLDEFERARYAVLPGITGLWQVARRNKTPFSDMINLDIIYCRHWSPLLDVTIVLKTPAAVFLAAPTPERPPSPAEFDAA